MTFAAAPVVLQMNTRIWLGEVAAKLGRAQATLDDVDDGVLDDWQRLHVDAIWLLGVWQTGALGRQIALCLPYLYQHLAAMLPDFGPPDVCSSPFAVTSYVAHVDFGGPAALARFRLRLRERGLGLMLDFVPNHTARDHAWVEQHPEYYVHGSERDLVEQPENYCKIETSQGRLILAHGRDPYFPGWTDTLQLNYCHAGLRAAMRAELLHVASQCDAVRCDMAMLLLPDVFERTWGERAMPADDTPAVWESFWPGAIETVRLAVPGFIFLAEVYWNRDGDLQQAGFDFTYDKVFYDRLRLGWAAPVREQLQADLAYQRHCARFVENHDEERAAVAFPNGHQRAAAVLVFTTPGLKLLHDGQFEGRTVREIMQVARRPDEAPDLALRAFYERLLEQFALHGRPGAEDHSASGSGWRVLSVSEAWPGNFTCIDYIALWQAGAHPNSEGRLTVVNFAPHASQGRVEWPLPLPPDSSWVLADVMNGARYNRTAAELSSGLYVDRGPWEYHLFDVRPCSKPPTVEPDTSRETMPGLDPATAERDM